jgi:hypothetical protein
MDASPLTALLSQAFDEVVYTPPPGGEPEDFHPPLPVVRSSYNTTNPWDPRLILDLAIGLDDIPTILTRYELSEREFNLLSDTPLFRRDLAMAMREVRENGASFSCKARFQAESYLEVMDEMVYDLATPANVRLETIRSAVRWGRLEPKEDKESGVGASAINIQINF